MQIIRKSKRTMGCLKWKIYLRIYLSKKLVIIYPVRIKSQEVE